jgi:hypothetical protein
MREEGCPEVHFASNRYQETSELAFHLEGQPEVRSLNLRSRTNQYDLWPTFPEVANPGDCLLFVAPDGGGEGEVAVSLATAFASMEDLGPIERRRDTEVVGRLRAWAFHAWTGDAAPFHNGY